MCDQTSKFFRPWCAEASDSSEVSEVSEVSESSESSESTSMDDSRAAVVKEEAEDEAGNASSSSSLEDATKSSLSSGNESPRYFSDSEDSALEPSQSRGETTRGMMLDDARAGSLASPSSSTLESLPGPSSCVDWWQKVCAYPHHGLPLGAGVHRELLAGAASYSNELAIAGRYSGELQAAATAGVVGQSYYGVFSAAVGPVYPPPMEQAAELLRQEGMARQIKKMRPKKFRCKYCGVAFSNNGQLKGHVRIHTGERPFVCEHEGCGKSFTRNEELTRHKRIHTGLRPHACPICGKCFGRKDHLKKHRRIHENAYRLPIAALGLGPYALGHAFPPGQPLAHPYMYPT